MQCIQRWIVNYNFQQIYFFLSEIQFQNIFREIFAAIREVAHCAYGSCEIGNFPEIFQELNEHMHIRRLNFQDILQEPVKKVQNIELEERNRENFALEKIYESLKQLSGVCNEIEEFPEYFAQGNLPDLQNLTEDEVSIH